MTVSKINKDRIINLTVNLCSRDTTNPPGNEYLCNDDIISFFDGLNVDIQKYEKEKGRTNIVITAKGKKTGPKIMIVGHTDVVPTEGQTWTTDPFKPEIKEDRIYARGAIDDKGPFAATLEAVRVFLETHGNDFNGEIIVVSAADEEQGSGLGIKYLLEEIGLKCDYALIPDAGEFSQSTYGEMGIYTLEFTSKGRAYHGSVPEKGYSALVPLVDLFRKVNGYDWTKLKGHEDFDHAVLNIGLFRAGTAMNIVPDSAEFAAMWRYPLGVDSNDIKKIIDGLIEEVSKDHPDAKLSYSEKHLSIPFIGNKEGKLVTACREAADELDLASPEFTTMRAETVAKYIFQSTGAEVVVNGPQDGSTAQMHQPDEYVEIDALVGFAKYYGVILEKLLKTRA